MSFSVDTFKEKMDKSLENLKKEFKAQAFENAKKYDIKKVIPLYEDVYKKAISNS